LAKKRNEKALEAKNAQGKSDEEDDDLLVRPNARTQKKGDLNNESLRERWNSV